MKTIFIKVNHWFYDVAGCPHKSHESTIINREDMKKYCGYTNYKRLYELRYTANTVAVDETTKTIFQVGGYDGRRGMFCEVL